MKWIRRGRKMFKIENVPATMDQEKVEFVSNKSNKPGFWEN